MTDKPTAAALEAAELKNCPFCGDDGTLIPRAMPGGSIYFQVSCEWDGCGVKTALRTSEAEAIAAWNQRAQPSADGLADELHIVFDGPPGPEAGRFVECETPDGRSVNAGEWHERADGYWELRLAALRTRQPADTVERVAELQLAAFLAGRGSVTSMKHGTRVAKPAPTMDDFRNMAISAMTEER